MKGKRTGLPQLGLRIIKSAVGVFFCFVIYILRGRHGAPFYSALAVLWCIQPYPKDSLRNAYQRTFGTFMGAVFGLILLLVEIYVMDFGKGLLHYLVLSALIVPILYITSALNKRNAAYFSCVVYLSIVVNHLGDENPFLFVLNRSLDTLIGIFIALIINNIHIHGKLQKDVLFVADIDNALKDTGEKLTPYSRFYLRTLIEEGMRLTIMTLRTPATYLESMRDICPALPIIAMDGAVLYDVTANSYPKVYAISAERASELEKYITGRGFHMFTTVILDDVLLIYYDVLENEAEKKIYESLNKSPYRNYLKKNRPVGHKVVYFMLVDLTEKICALLDEMNECNITRQIKVMCYPSDDYPGFSYLKIYNQNASVENMIDYLRESYGLNHVVTVSDDHSRHDVTYAHHDCNQIVRRLGRLFYWGKT